MTTSITPTTSDLSKTFASFPPELLILIMQAMPGLRTLRNFVNATHYHQTLFTRCYREIFNHVLTIDDPIVSVRAMREHSSAQSLMIESAIMEHRKMDEARVQLNHLVLRRPMAVLKDLVHMLPRNPGSVGDGSVDRYPDTRSVSRRLLQIVLLRDKWEKWDPSLQRTLPTSSEAITRG